MEEIIKELELSFENYKKSEDEKYLTEIKNITGNSLNNSELLHLVSKEKNIFCTEMRNLFIKKQKSRISLLGEEQNRILEKKVFLQIIDFSWRSHLQYLEQLRQVIGLRQYGQKDPLLEFKKEAFTLFEELLYKLKQDYITVLLNLKFVEAPKDNIVENQNDKSKFKNLNKKVSRNEPCPCGSGKKYKKCCGSL